MNKTLKIALFGGTGVEQGRFIGQVATAAY